MKIYETVIGLEVHVELATKSKIFCRCSTAFGAKPNTQICPVCAGLPGALPVLNRQVVEDALAVGLAMHCEISEVSRFDRKNYFYPDNPQNYQISQLYAPLCRNGFVEIETTAGRKRIGIHEIHMEDDAGKLLHDPASGLTLVDYNRSGVPLIEIVTEPDFANADEVVAFLEQLRLMVRYLGVSDGKMQEGSMRADVNLSVREAGCEVLGTRTEMKNMNSFAAIRRAVTAEAARQIAILEQGDVVVQESRRWDEDTGTSYSMRSKEDAQDYRYFPEPDLPPIVVSEEWKARVRAALPEFREEKRARYLKEYEIPAYDIEILTGSKKLADLFEEASALCGQPKKVSNWLMGETMHLLSERGLDADDLTFSANHLADLIGLIDRGEIGQTVAKQIFLRIFKEDVDPVAVVRAEGLATVRDADKLNEVVETILHSNPKSVQDYLKGKTKAIGYLVGQAMREMKGQADPNVIREMLKERLEEERE